MESESGEQATRSSWRAFHRIRSVVGWGESPGTADRERSELIRSVIYYIVLATIIFLLAIVAGSTGPGG